MSCASLSLVSKGRVHEVEIVTFEIESRHDGSYEYTEPTVALIDLPELARATRSSRNSIQVTSPIRFARRIHFTLVQTCTPLHALPKETLP